MAILQNTMMTDTGTSSSLVKKPTTATTSAATSNKKTTTSQKKTTTPTSTATNATQAANTQKRISSGYSSGSSSSTPTTEVAAPPDTWGANYNQYLKQLNESTTNQYQGEIDAADAYKNTANKNLDNSANLWKTTYNDIENYINGLEASNAQREAAMNKAIEDAYNQLLGNANEYYNNVLGTYNRSMDFVNQGFNEGKATTQQARDEAIQLAAQLYAMGEESQNRQTEKDLRNQYISYMNGMRNMNQQLASQGINGGASETALLNALNGYESNRTDLDEARLAALGQLRQQQMQSDSAAEQTYLAALADLITNRTNQQLGVENTRSSGEYNYANMKNDATNTRSNQTLQAQQAYQQWASDILNQRSGNKTNYATAITDINNERNGVAGNYQNMYANALGGRTANISSSAEQAAYQALSEHNATADSKASTKNQTKKQKKKADKKKAEKENKKNGLQAADVSINKTPTASTSKSNSSKSNSSKSSSSKSSSSKSSSSKSNTSSNTKSNTSSKSNSSKKKDDKKDNKKKKK